jgi:hypothetical protein
VVCFQDNVRSWETLFDRVRDSVGGLRQKGEAGSVDSSRAG